MIPTGATKAAVGSRSWRSTRIQTRRSRLSTSDHAGPNGVDFCRTRAFGFEGDALVALFGDFAPVTSRAVTPRGFEVVRVAMQTRRVEDFAVNKIAGPASKLPHEGLERPSHCQFAPDGALDRCRYSRCVEQREGG